jgi:hypothetical protein
VFGAQLREITSDDGDDAIKNWRRLQNEKLHNTPQLKLLRRLKE